MGSIIRGDKVSGSKSVPSSKQPAWFLLQQARALLGIYLERFENFKFQHKDGYNMHEHCREMLVACESPKRGAHTKLAIDRLCTLIDAYYTRFKNFKFYMVCDNDRASKIDVHLEANLFLEGYEMWKDAHK